jgi:geranylgeranyl pyrophosphate synthase
MFGENYHNSINPENEPEEQSPVVYREVNRYMENTNQLIEPSLRDAIHSVEDEDTRKLLEYFWEPRYKAPKVRPLLTRLAFAIGIDILAEYDPAVRDTQLAKFSTIAKLCTAIRLMDGATLIQDDALDHTKLRDGQESIYTKCGYGKALIIGDAAHSLANKMFSEAIQDQENAFDELVDSTLHKEGIQIDVSKNMRRMEAETPESQLGLVRDIDIHSQVRNLFDSIWTQIYEGQLFDIDHFGKDHRPTPADNERRLYSITGVFIEKVMALGCMWSGLRPEDRPETFAGLTEYGKWYGLATQLRNDLFDYAPNKAFRKEGGVARNMAYDDFKDGKQTLPIILAREFCSPEDWQYIEDRLGKEIDWNEKLKVNTILSNSGVFLAVQKQIFDYSRKALSALDQIPVHNRSKKMLAVWALALNNAINVDFALTGNRPEVEYNEKALSDWFTESDRRH